MGKLKEDTFRQVPRISGVSKGRVQKSTQPLFPSYRPVPAALATGTFQKDKSQEIRETALQKSRESHELVKKLFQRFDTSIAENKLAADDEISTGTGRATKPSASKNSMTSSFQYKRNRFGGAGGETFQRVPWIKRVSTGGAQKLTQLIIPSYRHRYFRGDATYSRTKFQKKKPQENPNSVLQKSQESHKLVKKLHKGFDTSLAEDK